MSSPVWLPALLDWLADNGVDVDSIPLSIGNMSRGYELFATRDLVVSVCLPLKEAQVFLSS